MALAGSFLFEWLHLSAELGAFCFGVLHAGEEKSDEMTEKLWGLREAFLIGFFLKIGLTGTPVWRDLAYASALVLFLPESLLITLATTVALSFLVGAPINKKATVISKFLFSQY